MNVEKYTPQAPNAESRGSLDPSRPKRHFWRWLLLLFVLGLAGYGLHWYYPEWTGKILQKVKLLHKGKPENPRPNRSIAVAVATAQLGDLPIYLEAPGTVIALNVVTVRSRVDGEIMKVNYVEGAVVREGDLLVQIDPRPFQAQLNQVQGQLARDEALLSNARLDLARYERAGKAATQQQLETTRATIAQYEGVIQTDQGLVENAKLQLDYCNVTAPLSGKIGMRLVDQGNIVRAGDAVGLAVITQTKPIAVSFNLAEDHLPQILKASGGGNPLSVAILNRDKTNELTSGTLAAIDNQIDLPTLTARFKATFDNQNNALFPNQAVNVRLLVETRKDVVLIPSRGVQRGPQSTFAYIVQSDNTVEMRPIQLGAGEGDVIAVEAGIAPGEMVVIAGMDNLAPGMKVTVPQAETELTSGTIVSEAAAAATSETTKLEHVP